MVSYLSRISFTSGFTAMYIRTKGEHAGEPAASLESTLVHIGLIKIDGTQVYPTSQAQAEASPAEDASASEADEAIDTAADPAADQPAEPAEPAEPAKPASGKAK